LVLFPGLQEIIKKDGLAGLFGRGLGTKLITNGIQGILFSVLWRLGQVGMWICVADRVLGYGYRLGQKQP
jgi:hypothetical protein